MLCCVQLELAGGAGVKRARQLLRSVGNNPQLISEEVEEEIDGAPACVWGVLQK
jgi:hypothetical protein